MGVNFNLGSLMSQFGKKSLATTFKRAEVSTTPLMGKQATADEVVTRAKSSGSVTSNGDWKGEGQ